MYERDTQSTTSADTTMQPLASDERERGILILGGTPIGNLSDASDRLRQALATADVIAVKILASSAPSPPGWECTLRDELS